MINITLPIDRIRDFFNSARFIPTEKAEKIEQLGYMKYLRFKIEFGDFSITKVNFKSFIIYSFPTSQEDADFLLEAQKLLEYVESCRGSSVNIRYDGEFVHLSDDKGKQKQKLKNSFDVNVDLFPGTPEINQDFVDISKEALDSVAIAKVSMSSDTLRPAFCAVYFEEDKIYASMMSNIYYRSMNTKIPKVALSSSECDMLSTFQNIKFSKSENYNTYNSGGVTYGFRTMDGTTGLPVDGFMKTVSKSNYININIEDLLSFCQSTIKFAGGNFCDSTLTVSEDDFDSTAELLFHDKEYDQQNNFTANITLVGEAFSFVFSPSELIPILKALPYKDLNIGHEPQGNMMSMWNEGDVNYIGILVKRRLA